MVRRGGRIDAHAHAYLQQVGDAVQAVSLRPREASSLLMGAEPLAHLLGAALARFFVFYVPLAYIGSVYFGLYGFFCGAVCGNLLMGIISYRTFSDAIATEIKLAESAA